jgi:ATP-dependent DNA ligase
MKLRRLMGFPQVNSRTSQVMSASPHAGGLQREVILAALDSDGKRHELKHDGYRIVAHKDGERVGAHWA